MAHTQHTETPDKAAEQKAKKRKQNRAYYEAHRGEIIRKARERYAANTDAARAYSRAYEKTHRKEINLRKQKQRAANPEAARERERAWYRAHREEINRKAREKYAARKAEGTHLMQVLTT